MKIDLKAPPPADIFRDRRKYTVISVVLLALALAGLLLMAYGIVSDIPSNEKLETVALALFAGPAVVFMYYGTRLQDYKKLNPAQQQELEKLRRKHPEIATYCGLVTGQGRTVIHAEYEAAKELDEDREHRG